MFIQSMERHMRYAIYGEEVAVILGVIGKKQLQKGDGQTQIGGNSNKLVTLTNGKGCNMVDFNTYQGWIQKYINNHDTREINFQNDVVKRLLEQLYPLYDIVCVDTKGGNSKLHDYYMYSGLYIDSKDDKKKPTTPDLLICKDWDWYNKDNDNIIYIATVEVKSPCSREAIYKKDFENYYENWRTKIERHLSAKKINTVIFTDTFKWDFFVDEYSKPETIKLVKCKPIGRGYSYEWREDAPEQFDKLIDVLNSYIVKI